MPVAVPNLAKNITKVPGTPVKPEEAKDVMLFQPFKQKSVTVHNHIGVSPMCMYSADDGFFNDFHVAHYGSFAIKGPGIVFIEATGVTPEGRITPQCPGLWKDEHIEGLTRVVDVIKSQGSTPAMQLAHAGRKASTSPPFVGDFVVSEEDGGWPNNVVAPSELPYSDHYPHPRALTVDDIKNLVDDFAAAAIRADKAGIEILEVHAAHGYLLSSFFSGNSNKRTDQYGGSFDNRIRIGLEVVKAVRDVWPESKPLWVRITSTDYTAPGSEPLGNDPDGWDIDQSVELAKRLKGLGVDLIDCSSGGNVPGVKYPAVPMYQVQFAEKIRREAEIPTAAVGLIVEGKEAEDILQSGKADFVLVGREFLRNSAFTLCAAQSLGIEINFPNQYGWAVKKARRHNITKSEVDNKISEETLVTLP